MAGIKRQLKLPRLNLSMQPIVFLISGRETHLTRAIAPLPYSVGLKCNYVTRLTT